MRNISSPTGIQSPDRPARRESPYRLRYSGPLLLILNFLYFHFFFASFLFFSFFFFFFSTFTRYSPLIYFFFLNLFLLLRVFFFCLLVLPAVRPPVCADGQPPAYADGRALSEMRDILDFFCLMCRNLTRWRKSINSLCHTYTVDRTLQDNRDVF